MNIIAFATGKLYSNLGMMKALSKIELTSLFLIDNQDNPKADFPSVLDKCVQQYDNVTTHNADYFGKLEYDNQIPLDKSLLDAFAPYMLKALKMLERTSEYDISFEDRVDTVFTHLKYWNTILEKHHIDVYLGLDVPHGGYNYIMYALCKIKGIKTIFSSNCPVIGYSYSMDEINTHCPQVKDTYQSLLSEYKDVPETEIALNEDFAAEYQKQMGDESLNTPYYLNDGSLPNSYEVYKKRSSGFKSFIFDASAILKMLTAPRGFKSNYTAFCFKKSTTEYHKLWDSLQKPLNMETEKFIYFPLHYQPEGSTMPQGEYFAWQYLAVEMLSKALPQDIYIYIKEYSKQTIKSRSLSFVTKLAALPNVKLVSPSTNTFVLMHNAIAVSTITGTAMWEGLFKGKPGIMFGHCIAQNAPGIFKVATVEDCKDAIDKILSGPCAPSSRELKIFLKAMQICTQFAFSARTPVLNKYGDEICSNATRDIIIDSIAKYIGVDALIDKDVAAAKKSCDAPLAK